jgi:thymidine kinase
MFVAQLYFYYSAMNAGKSTLLLQSAHNYGEQGMHTLLFTAAIDDRYGEGVIQSRIGLSTPANVFDANTQFRQEVEAEHAKQAISCILVDEAQFLSRIQVDQLARVVDELNIPVLCFGIRTDFQAEPFPGSARLLAIADKLSELKTVCTCGRKATMTVRIDEAGDVIAAGEQVQIGGNERYESKCRRHYQELMDSAKL